ncbi:MAG: NADH-quinone oxidoreductase subunit I [Phycisphaerae bacterium]
MQYFKNIYQAVRTIAAGLRVTLPYHFARTVVVQYPEVEPVLQKRYRGFHAYQIERCIACEACAKACPANCITVAKTGPRKMDKGRDIAVGGAMTEYRINHSTCLLCGLCTEVCPTECLKMGSIHDNSCYRREDLVTDYVQLAKEGRRTILPIWLTKVNLAGWAVKARDYWRNLDSDKRELMMKADDADYCKKLAEAGE